MRTHIISVDDVAPATITFDTLELDPDLPLEAQARWDLKEDLLMAEFPNGCALAIGWRPSFDPAGRFYVELNQRTENWEPFAEQQCRTILELKAIVSEFVRIARKRPSIPQTLLNSVTVQPASPLSDDLILDPLAPPEQQLERLRDDMFRAFLGLYRIRLDWLPPHAPAGEFVISLSRARSERDFDEPPEPVVERRCRGIPEMLAIFKEFIEQAKQADASEAQENRK